METFIGMVLLAGFYFPPIGWALCDGSLLQIQNYTALFSLIGTTYGGDGVNTFALPDLRGRVPLGTGQHAGGQNYVSGQKGGAESVSILLQQYPTHSHAFNVTSTNANTADPTNGVLAATTGHVYRANPIFTNNLNSNACTPAGGSSLPHENLQPYQALNWIICLEGIYPTQS